MRQRFRSGGLAAWSIHHPVGIIMLTLTVLIIGFGSLSRLSIDLLPQIIYPDIRVRITDPGVPAEIMEDLITRQLEEQLAITEGATQVQSGTREGRSSVDLSFPYGTDIDLALRDASTRLDRAKRFLPTTIEPPVIYKRDPSQIAVMEFVLSSSDMDATELRGWADYTFSKWFLNLPGVAAVEIGGGTEREIIILPDQDKLGSIGISVTDLADIISTNNQDAPGGRLITPDQEIVTRTRGRYSDIDELRTLPVWKPGAMSDLTIDQALTLEDVAEIRDGSEDERLRVRLDTLPGVKVSIQKLPSANTVSVVDEVMHRIDVLREQGLLPETIGISKIGDQSTYVRYSLRNAATAAVSGAVLAMLVIFLFLGNIKRTLIIGSAIPIGTMVTFIIMDIFNLTLNIMTLGGLALGMGLLIDSTIVMLENITRHQHDSKDQDDNAITAASEVNSPIVASTGTNLVAVLPFLFIGGLTGLLFEELIITITSAMIAAMIVALTLVPALGANLNIGEGEMNAVGKRSFFNVIRSRYGGVLQRLLHSPAPVILAFVLLLALALWGVAGERTIFLPELDEGDISIGITGETSTNLDEMDAAVEQIENLLLEQPEVESIFTTVGGFIFGRSEFEQSNRSSIRVKLVPLSERGTDSRTWARQLDSKIAALELTGFNTYSRVRGVRGLRLSAGDDDLSLRIQGEDIETLRLLADQLIDEIGDVQGLRNLQHTYQELKEELNILIDRKRAAELGVSSEQLGRALRIALDGSVISDYIDGDRQFDIRMRLSPDQSRTPDELSNLIVNVSDGRPVRLHEVATIERGPAPSVIKRDQQRRMVEISASLDSGADIIDIMQQVEERAAAIQMPPGYTLYDGGAATTLQESQNMGRILLALAIFLVLVVMAVQYESLVNPLVILFSIPFAFIGVGLGISLSGMPLSMSVWLGVIMLTGIVVNNAIVLVEQIEIQRTSLDLDTAIIEAASQRLRPIMMTTITTVFGMLPLAIGLGEGSEMLQPLAYIIVCGLSFSMFVSLVMVPVMYRLWHGRHQAPVS